MRVQTETDRQHRQTAQKADSTDRPTAQAAQIDNTDRQHRQVAGSTDSTD